MQAKTQKDTLKEPQKVAGSVPGMSYAGTVEPMDFRYLFSTY